MFCSICSHVWFRILWTMPYQLISIDHDPSLSIIHWYGLSIDSCPFTYYSYGSLLQAYLCQFQLPTRSTRSHIQLKIDLMHPTMLLQLKFHKPRILVRSNSGHVRMVQICSNLCCIAEFLHSNLTMKKTLWFIYNHSWLFTIHWITSWYHHWYVHRYWDVHLQLPIVLDGPWD